MAGEEDAELRDLVTQTLESRGILGKIRAQLRASVFVALEEQESKETPHPFVNRRLSEYLKSKEGQLAAGIVREFLEHFELDFTRSVFDPETNILSLYQGRDSLVNSIGLDSARSDAPLLTQILERAMQQQPSTRSKNPDSLTPRTTVASASSAAMNTEILRTTGVELAAGGASRKGFSPEEDPAGKQNGDGGGSLLNSARQQVVTKKSKEDLLTGSSSGGAHLLTGPPTPPPPHAGHEHSSPDHSSDFFEDSSKLHLKGPRVDVGKSKSKDEGVAHEGGCQSDEVVNLSESADDSEWLTGGKLETTDISVSHSGGDFDFTESIHSQ